MDVTESQLVARLSGLVGQRLWSATAGPKGDYVLVLEIGEKIPRKVRLSNPRLSFVKRVSEGTHHVLIECPWRLEGPDGVVFTHLARLTRDASDETELGEIEDLLVEAVEVQPAGWDLSIYFSGGYVLRCFSSEWSTADHRFDWTYWSPEGILRVGPCGQVSMLADTDKDPASRSPSQTTGDEPNEGLEHLLKHRPPTHPAND